MSSENWWRSPRSSGAPETRGDTVWPCLSPSRRRPLRRIKGRGPEDVVERIREQSWSVERSSVLDNEGYPKLGQRLSKRKLPGSQNPLPGCSEEIDVGKLSLENKESNSEDRETKTFSKKSRRTELICIELKNVLERQRSLSESQATSSPKPRIKLNLNLSIRNPLDSSRVISCRKGKQREVPRAKRISKLKRVIFRERQSQKQLNILKRELFDIEKMEAITKDVSEIDFARLKISGEPKPEVKFARSISRMSLFDNKHRKPTSDDLPDDDIPESSKNDVVSKLENLLIQRDRDVSPEVDTRREVLSENDSEYFMDSSILAKTLCLKICDETGETVEEFANTETAANVSDVITIPETAPDPRKHSKNFREYCTNDLTPELNKASENFLAEIYRLQKRMYERDEVKGRCRRRFFAGFKEVLKHVESKKIKFVFVAPDLEGIHGFPGGLDELVGKLIEACKKREVVFCFSLNKRKLGYYTHKKGSVSCVGITNYAGLEEKFKDVLTELMASRNSYGRFRPPGEPGAEILGPSVSDEWDDMLLSTRINLLFKSLAITG